MCNGRTEAWMTTIPFGLPQAEGNNGRTDAWMTTIPFGLPQAEGKNVVQHSFYFAKPLCGHWKYCLYSVDLE